MRAEPTPAGASDSPALSITAGQGRTNPHGETHIVAAQEGRVEALADVLQHRPSGPQHWWSPAVFGKSPTCNVPAGNPACQSGASSHRKGDAWLSTCAAGVDIDSLGHGEVSEVDRERLEQFVRGGAHGACLAHLSPHGGRLLYVLDRDLTDRDLARSVHLGAIDAARTALERARLGDAFKIDVAASSDISRWWWAPRAKVGDDQRDADVLIIRPDAFASDDLASLAPTPVPRSGMVFRRSSRQVFEEAVRDYNAAHRHEWPRSSGTCPACGHNDCFGTLPDDESRWTCFSSNHEGDSGGCGVKGAQVWTGDALDLDANTAGCSPHELLARAGFLNDGCVSKTGLPHGGAETEEARPGDRPALVFERFGSQVPLHELAPAAVAVLAAECDAAFSHGEMLAHVVRSPESEVAGGIRRSGAPRIVRMPDSVLREYLDAVARWVKQVRRKNGEVVQLEQWAPKPVADAVRDRGEWPGIRPLLGVTTAPTMRPDGSILDTPGYDEVTALLYEPLHDYRRVLDAPDSGQVRAALDVLLSPFAEFDLETPADRATLLAYMLTLAGRSAIVGATPMFLVSAPAYGSGKTLLIESATAAMTGHLPDMFAPVGGRASDAEAEMRKRLTTAVMEAPRAACIDNLDDGAVLQSRALAALLTSLMWSDRLLGANQGVHLPHRIVWAATGCNVIVAGDLARRSLSMVIDPGVEDPHLRTFKIAVDKHVEEEHPTLLVAALTILRGFVAVGRPAHGKPPLGKFEDWDNLVRAGVVWVTRLAGWEADPLVTQQRLMEATPDKDALGALLRAWHDFFGEKTLTCRDVARCASDDGDAVALLDAIQAAGCDKGGKADTRRLGHYLSKKAGNVVGGLVFERRGERQRTARWGVANRGTGGKRGECGSSAAATYARVPRAGDSEDGPHTTHETHGTHPPEPEGRQLDLGGELLR